jgi:hypothetical protein
MTEAKSRRVAAAARFLLSDKPGEVVSAVHAIGRLLPEGVAVPELIEKAITAEPRPSPARDGPSPPFSASWKRRARFALACPYLTGWERGFLSDVVRLGSLTVKQENCLRRLLVKLEAGSQ